MTRILKVLMGICSKGILEEIKRLDEEVKALRTENKELYRRINEIEQDILENVDDR